MYRYNTSSLGQSALLAIPKQVTQLCNISLTTDIFPVAWKEGKITPTPKKGNTANINNIRPITQTPIIDYDTKHTMLRNIWGKNK